MTDSNTDADAGARTDIIEGRFFVAASRDGGRVLFRVVEIVGTVPQPDGASAHRYRDDAGASVDDPKKAETYLTAEILSDGESAWDFSPQSDANDAVQFFGRDDLRAHIRLMEHMYDMAKAMLDPWTGGS